MLSIAIIAIVKTLFHFTISVLTTPFFHNLKTDTVQPKTGVLHLLEKGFGLQYSWVQRLVHRITQLHNTVVGVAVEIDGEIYRVVGCHCI